MKFKLLAIALLGLSSAVLTPAQTVLSSTAYFGTESAPLSLDDLPSSLNLLTFDSSLGELTNVVLTLELTGASLSSRVVNLSPDTKSFLDAHTDLNLQMTGPGNATANVTAASELFNGTAAGPMFAVTTAGTSVHGKKNGLIQISPADIGAFSGSGSGHFSVNLLRSLTSGGTANSSAVAFLGDATIFGNVRVDYSYMPLAAVPEPSTWAFISALAVFGGVILRRRFALAY